MQYASYFGTAAENTVTLPQGTYHVTWSPEVFLQHQLPTAAYTARVDCSVTGAGDLGIASIEAPLLPQSHGAAQGTTIYELDAVPTLVDDFVVGSGGGALTASCQLQLTSDGAVIDATTINFGWSGDLDAALVDTLDTQS